MLCGVFAIGLGACGSSAGSSSGTSASSASSRYQVRLTLAKCLRSHGLNVPDPSPNGAAGGGGGGFRAIRDQPNFRTAMEACAKYVRGAFGFGSLSPAQQAQLRQDLVKFAECMRSHNINIPDPSNGAGAGGGFGIFGQIPASERHSPAFRTALQQCSSHLPFRRGRGGPAGAPPGGGGGGPANPGV